MEHKPFLKKRELIALIIVVVLFVAAGLFVILHEISLAVDTTVDGIQYRINDPGYEERVTIKISGIYKESLFSDSTFNGKIQVSNYDFTKDYTVDMKFNGDFSYVTYYNYGDKVTDHIKATGIVEAPKALGQICTAKSFKQVMMTVFEEGVGEDNAGWNKDSGLVICAPAATRAEAVTLAEKLAKGSSVFKEFVKSWN